MKIEARDIHVVIRGVNILSGVSLSVEEGEVVALIGRNGAGKTTTLRTIMGVLKPARGSVVLHTQGGEVRLDRLPPYKVAGLGISLVPQGRFIFPDLTVEENLEVAYGSPPPRDRLREIYSIFPELERIRDRKGIHLSGGEQQMLAIARSLIKDPKIILLDEPLEGLAPKIVARVREVIKKLRGDGLGILITEAGNVKRIQDLIDRVYGIDRGETVFQGSLDEMLSNEDVRRRIWGI